MYRITRRIVLELPMAGDVVADCLRLIARLYAIILISDALMSEDAGRCDRRGMGRATTACARSRRSTLVAIYAFWRFLRFRMDSASPPTRCRRPMPRPSPRTTVKVAASRLRTLMPLLRAMAGSSHPGGRRPAGAVGTRRQHHAADRRRLGVRPRRVARQPSNTN